VAEKIIVLQENKLNVADQWDILLKNCDHVYFSPILKHPLTLENSHIEIERKLKRGNNVLVSLYREGILYSLYFFLRKKITMLWAKINKYHNIMNENE